MSQIVTITGDQGVEFGISRARPILVRQLFPWLAQVASNPNDDDFAFAPLVEDAGARADVSGSVGIAGMLHILHNSGKDMKGRL